MTQRIAVIGAGRVGQSIARLALAAGNSVSLAASGAPARTQTIADMFAPGARADWAERAAASADIVVLAVPLGAALDELAPELGAGRIVIDASNFWPETDGERPDLDDSAMPTSLLVQQRFGGAAVVKALNHVGYRDLIARAAPRGSAHRIGIGVAGDDAGALTQAALFVQSAGFDPVPAGSLADSAVLGPNSSVFGAVLSAPQLAQRIAQERARRSAAS